MQSKYIKLLYSVGNKCSVVFFKIVISQRLKVNIGSTGTQMMKE